MKLSGLSSTCHYSLSPGDPVEANGGSGDVARFDAGDRKPGMGSLVDNDRIATIYHVEFHIIV
jgi:hypothetical protein